MLAVRELSAPQSHTTIAVFPLLLILQVRSALEELQIELTRMPRAVHSSAAWIAADSMVRKYKGSMETLKSLLSDTLKERHWKAVRDRGNRMLSLLCVNIAVALWLECTSLELLQSTVFFSPFWLSIYEL